MATATLAMLVSAGVTAENLALGSVLDVMGRVTSSSRPVDRVLVVAFNLLESNHTTTRTGLDGGFDLPDLPLGIYRVIAIKTGFSPAITTIVPNRARHELSLILGPERPLTAEERDEIWAIRRALPSDVLREVDFALAHSIEPRAEDRFSGKMVSVTALPSEDGRPKYTQTDLGFAGEVANGWEIGFMGRLHQVTENEGLSGYQVADAEMSGLAMELSNEPGARYRIASSASRWSDDHSVSPTEIENHRISWERRGAQLELRYQNWSNLFPTTSSGENERVVIEGRKTIWNSPATDVGIGLRLRNDSVASVDAATSSFQTADVSVDTTHRFGSSAEVSYGFRSRHSEYGSEWSPETSATLDVGGNVSIVFSGLYKLYQSEDVVMRLPAVVYLDQDSDPDPLYRYSIGLMAGESDDSRVIAIASVSEIDSIVRVIFDDRFDDFWDGFYLEEGDVHSDLTVSVRKTIGDSFAIDVSTKAGRSVNKGSGELGTTYFTGEVQSLFRPSGTSLDVAYRYVEHPGVSRARTENERLLLRMGQSLRLPLDVRLLVGVDLARMVRSGVLDEANGSLQTRLVGGFSVAF